ncbi:MAG: hypothetical protein HZC41_26765 [Chloroflexi bacterium]|nr:hypothetical protein [Chloroflexota bacterium]
MWPLTKEFSFVSPYSLKECKKALKHLESCPEITMLEVTEKTAETYFRLGCYQSDGHRRLAYAEAEMTLSLNETGDVKVRGTSNASVLQILFYTYFVVIGAILAFIFYSPLILFLFFSLFAIIFVRRLRLVFNNQERLISIIYDALGVDKTEVRL